MRKCGRVSRFIAVTIWLLCLSSNLTAQLPAPYFYDDFEDGGADDGDPVAWLPWVPFGAGTRVVAGGSYTVTPGDQTPDVPGYRPERTEANSTVEGFVAQDVSIRALISLPEYGDYWTGFAARDLFDDANLNGSNVAAGLQPDGSIAIWTQRWTDQMLPETVLQFEELGLDLTGRDVYLELNMFGREVSLRVWPEGEPKPGEPQISTQVPPSFVQAGEIGLFNYVYVDDHEKPVSFRYIAALPTASSPTLPGDFDEDFVLTANDIDLLAGQLRAGSTDLKFDSNYDGQLDPSDHGAWVRHLAHTWYGDADLNGEFDSGDLIIVLASGKYETDVLAAWPSGDFNGDGRANSGDLVAALADGGYEAGRRVAVAAVPEPSSGLIVAVSFLSFLLVAGRHSRIGK